MFIRFWGVRGSIPTPGRSTVRYGGNTPCVELRLDNDELIILDAGTGIRALGENLIARGESVRAHLLITHPHWDHIQGYPFFKPAFIPGNDLTIVGTDRPQKSLSEILGEQMNQIYFPVQLHELKAQMEFLPVIDDQVFHVSGATVRTLYVNHPGYTVGYRIDYKGKSLVYISDNEPFDRGVTPKLANFEAEVKDRYMARSGDPNQRVYDFCRGTDLLIHDSTYTPEEYLDRVGWGHSDYLFTLKVAAASEVKQLYLFHYDHNYSDDRVDDILRKCQREVKNKGYPFACEAAVENLGLTI
jgi:phosphoribosyl 1,2-cyclic phosphodiesterase